MTSDRIEAVAACSRHLTAWEIDFVESVQEWINGGHGASEAQVEKFDEIEARLMEDGHL